MGLFNRKKGNDKPKAKKEKKKVAEGADELLQETRDLLVDKLFDKREQVYTKFYEYVDRETDYFYGKIGDYSDARGNVDFNFEEIWEYAREQDKKDGGTSHYYEELFWEFYNKKLDELKVYWNDNHEPLTVMVMVDEEPEHATVEVASPQFQDFLVGEQGHHAVKTEESLAYSIDLLTLDDNLTQTWELDENGNWPWLNDDFDIMALAPDYDYSTFLKPDGEPMDEKDIDNNLALFDITLSNTLNLLILLHEAMDNNLATLEYMKKMMADTKVEDFILFEEDN